MTKLSVLFIVSICKQASLFTINMTPSTFTKSPVLQVKEKTVKVDGEVWTGAGDGRQGHVVDSDHLALVVNTEPRPEEDTVTGRVAGSWTRGRWS